MRTLLTALGFCAAMLAGVLAVFHGVGTDAGLYHLFYFIDIYPCLFIRELAATCSPTPSPVQYHRPLRS